MTSDPDTTFKVKGQGHQAALLTARVVKDTFLKYLNTKYKILLRNVFEILLSNTSTLWSKIQNTLFAIVFEIQNTQNIPISVSH